MDLEIDTSIWWDMLFIDLIVILPKLTCLMVIVLIIVKLSDTTMQ
ncbi:MAG: hypothetical protein ACTSQK_10560 [Candidatus Heimdallarchaeota archaeon]